MKERETGHMAQFPDEPKMLTAAWLDGLLREIGLLSDVKLITVETHVPERTGILGSVVRCQLTYDGDPGNAPRSLIAKFAPPDPEMRQLLLALGMSSAEIMFYQQLAKFSNIPTPDCYHATIDSETGAFVLLLEDLSLFQPGSWLEGCTPEQAHNIVCTIAKLHAAWWDSPRLATLDLLTGSPDDVLKTMQSAWQPFVNRVGSSVPASFVDTGRRLAMHIDDIEKRLLSSPLTLIHNDFHLDNLFLAASGQIPPVTIIDWQFLAIDQGMKDVAFFVGGNLSSEDRRAHEGEILRAYHAALVAEGVAGYSLEQCVHDYRLGLLNALSRFLFSVGTYKEPDERLPFLVNNILPRFYAAILDTQADRLLPG